MNNVLMIDNKVNESTLDVILNGNVNSDTAIKFEDEVFLLLDDESIRNVNIDFTDVSYISSAGLRVIIKIYKVANKRNGEVIIMSANEQVTETFRITGLDSSIKMI